MREVRLLQGRRSRTSRTALTHTVRSRSKNEVPLTGKVVLVGQSQVLELELRRCGWRGDGDQGIELVEAPEVIAMDDPVATSVRRKKKSSLRVGSKLVIDGK